jgi:hypothetical protein
MTTCHSNKQILRNPSQRKLLTTLTIQLLAETAAKILYKLIAVKGRPTTARLPERTVSECLCPDRFQCRTCRGKCVIHTNDYPTIPNS